MTSVETMVSMQEALGPLAWAFHRQVLRAGAATDASGVVALAAALLMRETVDGDTCLSPEALAASAREHGLTLDAVELRSALASHAWVNGGEGATPLVFEEGRLYLRRFREAELRLGKAISDRVGRNPTDRATSMSEDPQAAAVEAGLRSRFTLITGGPGTGKTTTAATLIGRLFDANPNVRVALAAPTGKAAARLGEAVKQRLGDSPIAAQLNGQTLHRLLGYRPSDDSFRHDARDPLEHDVVIVDEASMVPLLLMDTLFAALRPDARIILLGDHDQLASVEAGSVLADLVAASQAGAPGLRESVVRLTRSYRFDDSTGIGAFARAVRDGDAERALDVLRAPDASIERIESVMEDRWLDVVGAHADSVFAAGSPEEALDGHSRIRVLCATNAWWAGTDAVTARIEQYLRARGHDVGGRYYRGRPLLVTRNDYGLGLFNGDVGVVWEGREAGDSAPRAFVAGSRGGGGATEAFLLQQLPEAVTAWAMTVHKSQGSEFDTVVVVLPEENVKVVSRELLYTAVTRAKRRVLVVGSDESVRIAVGRTARRGSGLGEMLSLAR